MKITYEELDSKYSHFKFPDALVTVKGKQLKENQEGFLIGQIEIELTSGYEASVAEIVLYGVFDRVSQQFKSKELSKYVELGADVSISLGYTCSVMEVFRGFIAGMTYGYEEQDLPCVRLTALDIKGLMMANRYSMQLTASSYGEAVREILGRPAYTRLVNELKISDTPDKKGSGGNGSTGRTSGGKAAAGTVEMTAESDYEFVVKAAKRFNYEIFTSCGAVLFRRSKSQKEVAAVLGLGEGIDTFEISYSLNGLVDSVEVRSSDPGSGKVLTASGKRTGKLSTGSLAARLLKKSRKVVIDPTAMSQEQLNVRRDFLLEEMSYRFGELHCEGPGIPDFFPGTFIQISGLGEAVSNRFYVNRVIHQINEDGYVTKLCGAADQLEENGMRGGSIL